MTLLGCHSKIPASPEPLASTPSALSISLHGVPGLRVRSVALNPAVTSPSEQKFSRLSSPVSHVVHETYAIGTPDHPTIDGGVINTTDTTWVIPAHPAAPITQPPAKPISVSHLSSVPSNCAFDDHWATNTRVQQLLETAAQKGQLAYVLQQAKAQKLPASIALLPMIESAYQTQALSPKGAGGLWQLMPSTAHAYGLSSQSRFSLTAATPVALQLLSQLHQQFGNWELAFAAYNAGPQRVVEALKTHPEAQNLTDLNLPLETQIYIQRLKSLNHLLLEMNHAPSISVTN